MKLYPIREWQEKDGNKLLPSIRLYVSRLHVATVYPSKDDPNLYTSNVWIDLGDGLLCNAISAKSLEDIKIDIECSLKEFVSRIMQPRKLIPVQKQSNK